MRSHSLRSLWRLNEVTHDSPVQLVAFVLIIHLPLMCLSHPCKHHDFITLHLPHACHLRQLDPHGTIRETWRALGPGVFNGGSLRSLYC